MIEEKEAFIWRWLNELQEEAAEFILDVLKGYLFESLSRAKVRLSPRINKNQISRQ